MFGALSAHVRVIPMCYHIAMRVRSLKMLKSRILFIKGSLSFSPHQPRHIMAPQLYERSDDVHAQENPTNATPIYIAGFAIAGGVLLLAGVLLAVRTFKRRERARDQTSKAEEGGRKHWRES